jgi:hypothetical protein
MPMPRRPLLAVGQTFADGGIVASNAMLGASRFLLPAFVQDHRDAFQPVA